MKIVDHHLTNTARHAYPARKILIEHPFLNALHIFIWTLFLFLADREVVMYHSIVFWGVYCVRIFVFTASLFLC